MPDASGCAVTEAGLTIRPAVREDAAAIDRLAGRAVRMLLGPFLREDQMAETDDFTVLDPWLLDDGTYFVVLISGEMIASGGWSRRQGHMRLPGARPEDARPIDPEKGAARIRAMYTDPDYARMGIGRVLLSVSETAARLAGYRRAELTATLVGEKLYSRCGWDVAEWRNVTTRSGIKIPVAYMTRTFSR